MAAPTKEKIIEQFNLSIDALRKAHAASTINDLNSVLNEIALSGGYIYQTLEWFLKNYLYSIFPDPVIHSSQHGIIEAPSFPTKVNLFVANASPTISATGIDVTTIKELKAAVRNNTEHSGITPHYNSLLVVLETTRSLLETYLRVPPIRLENLPNVQPIKVDTSNEWLSFFTAVENFSKEYNYILITDLSKDTQNTITPLGLVDWNAVIDLDPNSEISGFHSIISSDLTLRRSIHKYTLNDTLPSSFSQDSCYWIFANGLTGRINTHFPALRFWNSHYATFLNRVFSKLQSSISSKPTIVIVLTDNSAFASEISKIIFNSFTVSARFVFAVTDLNRYLTFAEEYEGVQVEINVSQIATGLLTIGRYFNPLLSKDEIIIPHKNSGFAHISHPNYVWLKEDLELLHRNLLDDVDESERVDFYKGGKISWKGLMLNYDLQRDYNSMLEARVDKSLRERTARMISLFHYPGIGGSTISRHVAWQFKDRYPVACLKTYRPIETINRIYELFQLSALPPLILMDSEYIGTESRKRILDEALIRSFPVTFLEVQRKVVKPSHLTSDQVYVTEVLSDNEVFVFAKSYGELAPDKKSELNGIIKSPLIQEKHPLFFGLTAFEDNFRGLHNFVESALESATNEQKKIISFICFAGVYAQKAVPAQSFCSILALPESQAVKLESHIHELLLHLIVREIDYSWKPLHYLIAKEFLKTIYGVSLEQMRIGLSDLSIEFMELIGNRASKPTTAEYDLLDRIFIGRHDEDGEDEDEKQFSKLVREGLYDENARLRVFVRLTEVFPDRVHYWSHLARFYNLVVKDQNSALNCIDTALELDSVEFKSKDSTLYHIKGMILKSQAAALMQRNWHKAVADVLDMTTIKNLITHSNEQFEESRRLNINSDYGYITDIDAITHYLDFKFKKSSFQDRSKFLANLDNFDLKLFTKARMLLEEVRSKLHHNPDDFYYVRARNKLQEYFNNYSSIIQSWQNLLSANTTVDKSAIRQSLAHAYVSRANGWDKLDAKDLDKVLRLLSDNVSQEPGNGRNIFLWFKAARYSSSLKVTDVLPKLAQWKSSDQSIEASFYLSILYVIEAIDGNSISAKMAANLIREVSEKSRSYPYRAYVSEWYGKGLELARIKKRSVVVSRDEGDRELTFEMSSVKLVNGKIAIIKGPESGEIEFASGLMAYFVPARADGGKGFVKGRDENKDVTFILGFSYDGLRAYGVNSEATIGL
ncbi:hypothetical protein [Dyadobacter bucti]|uniref:hypothetical protein n=1 Tax=Dyadobacter bucti TaxID=2572203 RepID=UPI001108DE51|nr:hypothetical protein [Dyadobacter bucti]